MGHQVFSNGAYRDPKGSYLLPRPALPPQAPFFEKLSKLCESNPQTNMPIEMFEGFDTVIFMHMPEAFDGNWKKIKAAGVKNVIFRSIGQSRREWEVMLTPYKQQGLKIVRYSHKERLIPSFAGEDALIRFYKDEGEFKDWNGNTKMVVNISQSLKARGWDCHYDDILKIMEDFPHKIYGSGNNELGVVNGGTPTYQILKEILRDSRVFVYGGTWPAPYTLSLMEAMMTGIPIVAIGKGLAENNPKVTPNVDFYEVSEIIENGVNGFISDNIKELRKYIELLLSDYELAKRIGAAGRQKAISLWGKDLIKKQWSDFFNSL